MIPIGAAATKIIAARGQMRLKIVKCQLSSGGLGYSIRIEQDDMETELVTFDDEHHADATLKAILRACETNTRETTAVAVAALLQIHGVAERIGTAGEAQGQANYATKSHMRSWGAQIFNIATVALKSCDLDVKPDRIPRNSYDVS
jgi:hypothetical protein